MKDAASAVQESRFLATEMALNGALETARSKAALDEVVQTTHAFTSLYCREKLFSIGESVCIAQLSFLTGHHAQQKQLFPVLCDLGFICNERGDREAAKRYLAKAVTMSTQVWGSFPSNVLFTPFPGLAKIYLEDNQVARAVHLYERMIRLWDTRGLPHEKDYAKALITLARLYAAEGDYQSAAHAYRRGFQLCRECDVNPQEYADSLRKYAEILYKLGRSDEAADVDEFLRSDESKKPAP